MNYGQGAAAARTVALVRLGDLLNTAEDDYEKSGHDPEVGIRLVALREARDRVAEAAL